MPPAKAGLALLAPPGFRLPRALLRSLCSPAAGSLALLAVLLAVWHLATAAGAPPPAEAVDPEYARLMGGAATAPAGTIPGPAVVAAHALALGRHALDPGGIVWQLAASLARVLGGYAIAVAVGLPAGLLIGLSPRLARVLDPYVQLPRPISPLAWMSLALYALKDSGRAAIFIIAVSAVWPVLVNSAAGASGVRTEWLNVARVLDLPWRTRLWRVVLPDQSWTARIGMRARRP